MKETTKSKVIVSAAADLDLVIVFPSTTLPPRHQTSFLYLPFIRIKSNLVALSEQMKRCCSTLDPDRFNKFGTSKDYEISSFHIFRYSAHANIFEVIREPTTLIHRFLIHNIHPHSYSSIFLIHWIALSA